MAGEQYPAHEGPAGGTGLGGLEDSRPWLLAGIGGLVAGGIHLALAPGHLEEAAGHGLFFFSLGTVQIGWALWHLARPSYLVWLAGISIAFGSILVYVAALLFPAPFSDHAEPVDYAGRFTKAIELATLVVLFVPLVRWPPAVGRPRRRVLVASLLALAVGLGGSAAALGGGYGAEMLVPELGEPGGHGHGNETEAPHGHFVEPHVVGA